jgi:hypothetical protein
MANVERTTMMESIKGGEGEVDPAEYARLLELYDSSFRNIAEGEVVKGTVLKVTASEVIVDVGYKSEGIIPVSEFIDENGQVTVQPGDLVDVLLEKTEDKDGYVVLSREKAEKMKIWDDVEKAYADRKVVIGRVIERLDQPAVPPRDAELFHRHALRVQHPRDVVVGDDQQVGRRAEVVVRVSEHPRIDVPVRADEWQILDLRVQLLRDRLLLRVRAEVTVVGQRDLAGHGDLLWNARS